MKLNKPAPRQITYRGNRYDWVGNYHYKKQAQTRIASLNRQGASGIIVDLLGKGDARHAVYVKHNLRGILAK